MQSTKEREEVNKHMVSNLGEMSTAWQKNNAYAETEYRIDCDGLFVGGKQCLSN
jgi:hypothetical protein